MEATFAEHLIDKTYGGVSRRIAAYGLDCALLFLGFVPWQAVLYFVNPMIAVIRSGQQPTASQVHAWVFATITVPTFLYFALMLRSARQATFGMRWLKLRVADVNDKRVGLTQALVRSFALLIPFELNHTVMFHLGPRGGPPSPVFWLGIASIWVVIALYIASMLWTRRHQSVHDLIAGTVVYQLLGDAES